MPHIHRATECINRVSGDKYYSVLLSDSAGLALFYHVAIRAVSRIFNLDKFNMDKPTMSPTHKEHIARQPIRGAKKNGSNIAESVLRNHSPANIHFDVPNILVWFHAPRRRTIRVVLAGLLEVHRQV